MKNGQRRGKHYHYFIDAISYANRNEDHLLTQEKFFVVASHRDGACAGMVITWSK